MSYQSETIADVLPRLNSTYFLPAMQREFVWTEGQVCALFDSLMRRYPISSFLFWQVPMESRDDVEAYEFLHSVNESRNRAKLARIYGRHDITFVLDGQQRLTALNVGLQGTYLGKKSKGGKGARTPVAKKLFLDLLHDGRLPDSDGEISYKFEFFDYTPTILNQNSYWFEVRRILDEEFNSDISDHVDHLKHIIRDVRGKLTSLEANIVEHNLTTLFNGVCSSDAISYHTESDADHERILEIFVRANSGGTILSKSDLLLSTLTLHWSPENAREVINGFVDELNKRYTRKKRLNKDFVMKSCLVLLDHPVAYRVSSFTKGTCTVIRSCWDEVRQSIKRAVDAASAFGIDEDTLTSVNALIPVAYYLHQHPNLKLLGESEAEVRNAKRVRVWLISVLLNHVLGGSSDSMLHKLREALQIYRRPNGDFPIMELNKAIAEAGRIPATSDNCVENVLSTTYGKDTCFLALSLLYDDRNWGNIPHSIDHLFPKEAFKKNVADHVKEFRDDFGNLALVISDENSGKQDRPLGEWLTTRSPEYLKRHFIPPDQSLWHIDRFETFLIERRKLLRARLQNVFSTDSDTINL
jgi:hypothetical protein